MVTWRGIGNSGAATAVFTDAPPAPGSCLEGQHAPSAPSRGPHPRPPRRRLRALHSIGPQSAGCAPSRRRCRPPGAAARGSRFGRCPTRPARRCARGAPCRQPAWAGLGEGQPGASKRWRRHRLPASRAAAAARRQCKHAMQHAQCYLAPLPAKPPGTAWPGCAARPTCRGCRWRQRSQPHLTCRCPLTAPPPPPPQQLLPPRPRWRDRQVPAAACAGLRAQGAARASADAAGTQAEERGPRAPAAR